MPHDRNGFKIDVGDFVKTQPYNHRNLTAVIGRVADITAAQKCTGQIVWPEMGGMARDYFGADECEIVLKADGTSPFPTIAATDPPVPASA
jgi:hypothetical protein